MNRIIFFLFFLSVLIYGKPDAMSWPSEDAVLTGNFGSNDNGKPVLGMHFNGGTDVLAAEKGEVIFTRDKNNTASRFPSVLGAWTAVDHGDGLISIYSRYSDDKSSINKSASLIHVEKSQPIASSGISGLSAQKGFYFIIFDRKERHWINPALIITPVLRAGIQQIIRPPQILSVDLRDTQKNIVQSRNLAQGRYTVVVNTNSPSFTAMNQRNLLAPQRIVCSVNGAEAGSINFEAFFARDGVMMVYRNGIVPAKQVYSSFPAFETAEILLTRGQANLEIVVQDIAGNSNTVIARLIVN